MAPGARWPGVMARALGTSFEMIEEGLRGRTTVTIRRSRGGMAWLISPPCLFSHAPLDLAVISLGCNDTKAKFSATPEMIAAGAERLLEAALISESGPGGVAPRMILVAPPPISKLTEYAEMLEGGADKALSLPPLYRAVAERHGAGFVDAGAFISCSPLDGIHYAPDQHAILGAAMAEAVRMMLE